MKRIVFILSFFALIAAVSTSCSNQEKKADASEQMAEVYQCPMDCEDGKTYDKPGKCPVCGMDLEKVEHSDADGHTHDGDHDHSHEGDHTHSSDSVAAPAN